MEPNTMYYQMDYLEHRTHPSHAIVLLVVQRRLLCSSEILNDIVC